MFYNDHAPPHFHARYGADHVAIEIESLRLLEGHLPPRALGLVIEWAAQRQPALLANWQRARDEKLLVAVSPLQ